MFRLALLILAAVSALPARPTVDAVQTRAMIRLLGNCSQEAVDEVNGAAGNPAHRRAAEHLKANYGGAV
jgi:hypothetical protein